MSKEDYLSALVEPPDWVANPPSHIVKSGSGIGNLALARMSTGDAQHEPARAILNKLAGDLASETQGGRNDLLNKTAHTMGGFVASGSISRAEVEAALRDACHRNGLMKDGPRAVETTLRSGLDSGLTRPIASEHANDNSLEWDTEPAVAAPISDISLSSLTRPPGLVGQIIDWIEASSVMPSREVALPAALGWVAALAGRGYETPRRARTNLFMVAVAPSGFGKDHPGACINSLADACGLDCFLGPARFMSASGLRETLMDQPSVLCILDEFGGFLRQINGQNVGLHNEMIRTDLLQLFSRAKDLYAGAAYAGNRAVRLYNPNLVISGMSTPSDFWAAVQSARTYDGFLARFLIFNVTSKKPALTVATADEAAPPPALVKASQDLYLAVYGEGNLVAAMSSGANKFRARRVSVTDEATRAANAFYERTQDAKVSGEDQRESFLDRAAEHAWKLALTVAVGVNPKDPVIDAPVMQWSIDLAWLATCSMISEADARIADNERQRVFKRIVLIIKKGGEGGVTMSKIAKTLAGSVYLPQRDEILKDAQQAGIIKLRKTASGASGGRPSERYVHRDFLS